MPVTHSDTSRRTYPSRGRGAIAGLLAAITGLAFGELLSGLVKGLTSPVIGVGNRVVDLVPVPIKQFAIRTFGTHDKQALLVGIAATIGLAAIVFGIVATKHRLIGTLGVAGFGLVGAAAAVTGRTGSARDALPSLLAAVVGVGVLVTLLTSVKKPEVRATEPPIDPLLGKIMSTISNGSSARVSSMDLPLNGASFPMSRRRFTALSAGFTATFLMVGTVGRRLQGSAGVVALRARLALPNAKHRLPKMSTSIAVPELVIANPFITPNRDFYRIDTALVVPKIDVDTWKLKITGLVDQELSFTYEDLLARALIEQDITLTCVSNEVGGILMGNARWLGIPLRELLDEAGIQPKASQIVGRSTDGWTSGFPISVLGDGTPGSGSNALVAVGMNGEPLPFAHGFPARLVVPGLYGYVSATKWLDTIEVTTLDAFDAYWVPRGYAKEAPIKLASRIDVPRGLSTIPSGRAAVAGVAWSQTVGVAKVEVKIDDADWKEATLADEQSIDTWRQWRFEWDALPGRHEIAVRATDKQGHLQIEERTAPLPNGATGWHQVIVLVS